MDFSLCLSVLVVQENLFFQKNQPIGSCIFITLSVE
jgi:hypothetical protein